MRVNAIFDNVKVYDVQNRLDVVNGESFSLEVLEGDGLEIFTNNDPILTIDGLKVSAAELGESKIRFMSDTAVVKDIVIVVVDHTAPNASTLGLTLGEPVQK